MKKQVSILTLCLLFVIACANNNNQIPNSLSSSYDCIWDGYAQTPYERQYIKMEIKNGIVSGFVEFDGWYKGFEVATSGEKKSMDTLPLTIILFSNPLILDTHHGGPTPIFFSKPMLCRPIDLKVLTVFRW